MSFEASTLALPSAEMITELLADVERLLKRAANSKLAEDREQIYARVSFHRRCAESVHDDGIEEHVHTAPLPGMERKAAPNADDSEFLYANEMMNEMAPQRHFHKRCPCLHASAPNRENIESMQHGYVNPRKHVESSPLAVTSHSARVMPMRLNMQGSALLQRRKLNNA